MICAVQTEIKALAPVAEPFRIVRGARYLYFPLQNSQEEISFHPVAGLPSNLQACLVKNYKNTVIGYSVAFMGRKLPVLDLNEFGAAIFFGKAKRYRAAPQVLFTDQKFRVVGFDGVDFWVSVKWKSQAQKETE